MLAKYISGFTDSLMAANIIKTKLMLVTTCQKGASLPDIHRSLHVKMNGDCLENVYAEKLPGVKINCNK